MSKYDAQDGYEDCEKCGALTKEMDGVCLICKSIVIVKQIGRAPAPRPPTKTRTSDGTKRNHSQGHGWKENHKS